MDGKAPTERIRDAHEASFVTGHALVVDGGCTAGHCFGRSELMGLG